MKVYDIIKEYLDDEPVRDMPNPIGYEKSQAEKGIDYMEQIDDVFAQEYKQELGIEKFSTIEQMGDAIKYGLKKYGAVKFVPIAQLIPTEENLYRDYFDKILKGGDFTASSEHPILYKMNNIYFIGDGNHRIAVEKQRGENMIRAVVLDGNKILKR